MALIVQKYGGTSVGTVERIQGVANKVKGFRDQGHNVVVVVSAMSGETNRLIGGFVDASTALEFASQNDEWRATRRRRVILEEE